MDRDVVGDVAALRRGGECGVQCPVDVTDRLRGERFAERLFRLSVCAEPTSGRLSPLHLPGVRVEPRRPIEADPPPPLLVS